MLPADVSTEGWRIDRLLDITTVMVAVLTVFFVAWLVFAFARRIRGGKPAPLPSRRIQIGVPLAFAVLILVVVDGTLLLTSRADQHGVYLDNAGALARPGAVRVEISAQQWAWNIRYAGPDGAFATQDDPVTVGDLVVPVNAPVVIELASSDVVHALHIPNVRIKRDAIPGRIARIWFEATTVGDYEILCAQFCGSAHYRMEGRLRVVSREDFDTWITAAAKDSMAIAKEEARSLVSEPSRRPDIGRWPRFEQERYGRDWGWRWGQ